MLQSLVLGVHNGRFERHLALLCDSDALSHQHNASKPTPAFAMARLSVNVTVKHMQLRLAIFR